MTCKGTCVKYKIIKSCPINNGRYKMGQKRCTTCGIYIKWDGKFCPCCGVMLRYKPRNTKNRQKLQEMTMIKRI